MLPKDPPRSSFLKLLTSVTAQISSTAKCDSWGWAEEKAPNTAPITPIINMPFKVSLGSEHIPADTAAQSVLSLSSSPDMIKPLQKFHNATHCLWKKELDGVFLQLPPVSMWTNRHSGEREVCWHTRCSAGRALKYLWPRSHMEVEMYHVLRCKCAPGGTNHQMLLELSGEGEGPKSLPGAPGNLTLSEKCFFHFNTSYHFYSQRKQRHWNNTAPSPEPQGCWQLFFLFMKRKTSKTCTASQEHRPLLHKERHSQGQWISAGSSGWAAARAPDPPPQSNCLLLLKDSRRQMRDTAQISTALIQHKHSK